MCELCLMAQIDPAIRERLELERLAEGTKVTISAWTCETPWHAQVMSDAVRAFRASIDRSRGDPEGTQSRRAKQLREDIGAGRV